MDSTFLMAALNGDVIVVVGMEKPIRETVTDRQGRYRKRGTGETLHILLVLC